MGKYKSVTKNNKIELSIEKREKLCYNSKSEFE